MDEDGLCESPEGLLNTAQALLKFSLASGVVRGIRNGNVVNIETPTPITAQEAVRKRIVVCQLIWTQKADYAPDSHCLNVIQPVESQQS
jgi:hypothetical protein